MLKPTTVRVPEDFLKELQRFIKEMKLDKSAYLREILRKGFEEDRRERILSRYQRGELSVIETCKSLGISPWEFFDLLKKENISLNVSLEDLLDSIELN
jgi:predicted HTH domain antitoxin